MIETVCINDSNKPSIIPDTHWVKKGKWYNIIMVYNMVKQEGILGVVLKEIDLESLEIGYSCFKIDRFAIKQEDIPALLQLIKDCGELNDFDPQKLIDEQVLVEV
jgi:hypothetical protein